MNPVTANGQSATENAAISVRDLRMSYGEFEAVKGVSFSISQGEVFALLGPNGAGKTTTIEILEGYRVRSGGSARVLGVDPGEPTRAWRARIGLVLQECQLATQYTVAETVTLMASLYPAPLDADEVLALVGLEDKRDERIGRLSGGQKRRVDVALGIIGDPDLIFLDEPTTGFDPSARRDAWRMIEGLKDLGKTILLTTHYMEEAQFLADRVAIMREGRMVALGTTGEIGEKLGDRTRISFRLPQGIDPAEIEATLGLDLEIEDGLARMESDRPQRELMALTSWAEDREVVLGDLEVSKPDLEEIFLKLVGSAMDASS